MSRTAARVYRAGMGDDERELDRWFRRVVQHWRWTGVPREVREVLLTQLRDEVARARAAGARVGSFTSADPAAAAERYAGTARETGRVSAPALVGLVVGVGALGALLVWVYLLRLVPESPSWIAEGAFYLGVDLVAGAGVFAVMCRAPGWHYGPLPEMSRLRAHLALTMAPAALVAVPAASAYGSTTGYSLAPAVVLTEALLVATALGLAVLLAHRWTYR